MVVKVSTGITGQNTYTGEIMYLSFQTESDP